MKTETKSYQSVDTVKALGYIIVNSETVMICDSGNTVGLQRMIIKKVHGLIFGKYGNETGKIQMENYMGSVHGTRWGNCIYEVCGVFNSKDDILFMMINFDDAMNEDLGGEA